MAADPFVHLHLHTEYSLLDGAVRIKDLMAKAVRYKMPAVAMTDHGNVFGAIEFYTQAKKAGIKPIIGCEVYLTPPGIGMDERKTDPGKKRNSHLTLLSATNKGWENLIKLVSKAHLEGMYYKPRIDKEALAEHSEGLICLSGCINGEINQFIQEEQLDAARRSVGEFIDIFGRDNFYLEMHDHGMEQQRKCNAQLVEFSKEFDLSLVAANDVHFLNRNDHEAHDVMICIGTNSLLMDENRMRYSPEVYFKKANEMRALFKDVPEALANTLEIAEKCNVELELDSTSSAKYPQFPAPGGQSREEYFRDKCYEGLAWRYGEEKAETDEELKTRLDYEIKVMQDMGFLSYFLITWDFIKWAKDNGVPVGPGRGSAAGSLVAYVLGITDLCPIRFGLIFERFLNPERISPPDIDVDFCQARRGKVIEYVRQKYGERAVSHIVTFGTLGAKSVVRDVGRVMGLSYTEGDRIAKMIPTELNITLSDARKKNPELRDAIENEDSTNQLWQYATYLEGLTRGTGIHAAGVVIGDRDLTDYVPLTRGKEGEVVTQFAMNPLTELGMLKMDFLGLKTLTVIKDAEDLIQQHTPDFRIDDTGLDDQATFDLLNRGETIGVFQLESGGMMNLCRQFGVDRIEDIIALIALYRPGPMDLIPDYIDRKKGKKKVEYLHPLLEEVSSETYGILIYQEQVQRAANVLAGYSLGDADLLRRAMGKKKLEEMVKQRQIFVEGCKRVNNIHEKLANEVFDLLEKFAGYGFNKSHSAAYGLISYRTAYLKANYPVEFMAALLSNEINNTDKISVFVAECKRMGIEILAPDVNRSALKFAPEAATGDHSGGEKKAIRFGLAAIKNVGEAAMETALAERAKNGPFASLDDFGSRLDTKQVNRKILESLIKAGAFDFTGEWRDAMFSRLGQVVASASAAQRDRASGQVSLFDMGDLVSAAPAPSVDSEDVVTWNKEEMLTHEKDLLGFFVTGHPLDAYRHAIEDERFKKIGELEQLKQGSKGYLFAGIVGEVQVKYTRRDGKPFAVMVMEDFTGPTEVMVWSDEYAKRSSLLIKGKVIVLKAKVEMDARSESRRLTAVDIFPIQAEPMPDPEQTRRNGPSRPAVPNGNGAKNGANGHGDGNGNGNGGGAKNRPVILHLSCGRDSVEDLLFIKELAKANAGDHPLVLQFRTQGGREVTLHAGRGYSVSDSLAESKELARWL